MIVKKSEKNTQTEEEITYKLVNIQWSNNRAIIKNVSVFATNIFIVLKTKNTQYAPKLKVIFNKT